MNGFGHEQEVRNERVWSRAGGHKRTGLVMSRRSEVNGFSHEQEVRSERG